jgi:hypothetical protein
MPLSADHQAQVKTLLGPLCAPSPDPAVRAKLRVDYRLEGNSVILFEARPHWQQSDKWIEEPVAKFQYVASIERWRLFCRRRDLRWHGYTPLPQADTLEELVQEVESDLTGIFWG